jgi:acyl-CoA thioesterase-1
MTVRAAMPNLRLVLAWLVAALAILACERPPQLAPLAAGDTIVAFGDSLTQGTGTSEEFAYPAVLARLIKHPVVNAGVPGETTSEGLERLPEMLEEQHPKLVLLCLGGNDMLRKLDPGATEANLRSMIQAIRAHGSNVVLIGVPEPKLFSGPPALYEKLAKEFKLPYDGEVFNKVLKNPRLKSDPIHANAEGYRIVAEHLAQLLRDTGAVQ